MNKILIDFPIGDWSGDGHNQCTTYTVKSAKPVDDLREAHFKCKELLGFAIGDMCKDYEEFTIREDILDILEANKLLSKAYYKAESAERFDADPEELCEIWVNVLNHIDTTLELELTVRPKNESINFYGFDEKRRHLSTPGYGLFE